MKEKWKQMFVAVLAVCVLSGCTEGPSSGGSSQHASSTDLPAWDVPERYLVQRENRFDYQPGGIECAAFSSAYLLRHYGEEASGLPLFENFPGKLADGNGVYPSGIVEMFAGRGYEAEFITGATVDQLKQEVAKGAPVIVFIHVEVPYSNPHYTHYIPVVGYDEQYIYFAESLDYLANCKEESGLVYNRKTPIEEFEKLWSNIDGVYEHPYFRVVSTGGEDD